MQEITHVAAPGLIDAAGNLVSEIPCRKCGYALRGLNLAGRCPECGSAVGLSIHGDLLRFSDPAWLRTLQRGVRLVIASIAIQFLAVISIIAMSAARPAMRGDALFLASIIGVVGAVLGFLGGWQLTEPDPSGIGEDRYGTSRRIIRIALAIGIINTLLHFIENLSTVPPAVRITLTIVAGVSGLAGLIGHFAQLNYLSKLALRIPDVAVAKRARFLMWAIGISYGFVLVVGGVVAVMTLMSSARPQLGVLLALGCPIGLATLAVLVFGIMYLLMLEKLGQRFGEEARMAEATWNPLDSSASISPAPTPPPPPIV